MSASYKTSMTSQIVFWIFIVISLMQLYLFFMTMQILPLFASMVQMFFWAYLQKSTNFLWGENSKNTTSPVENLQNQS